MRALSVATILLAISATTSAPGHASQRQSEPARMTFPEWSDKDISACLDRKRLEAISCWPKFDWATAPIMDGYEKSYLGLDSDIRIFLKASCDFTLAGLSINRQQTKGRVSDLTIKAYSGLEKEVHELISRIERKAALIGWEAEQYEAAIHAAQAEIAQKIEPEKFGTLCPEAPVKAAGLIFSQKLKPYEQHRDRRLLEFIRDPANRQVLDESTYLERPGIGFMTILGRDPSVGRICSYIDALYSKDVLRENLIPEDKMPGTLRSLPNWFNHAKDWTTSQTIVSWDELKRTFVAYPANALTSPLHNNECAFLVASKKSIHYLKKSIEDEVGLATYVFPETIDQSVYDATLAVRDQEFKKSTEEWERERPTRGAENQRIAADHRAALNYFKTNGDFECTSALAKLIADAEKRGGGVSRYLSEQSFNVNARNCMVVYYQSR